MRRARGEAAEAILQAVKKVSPRGLSYPELCEATSLSPTTVRDNVKILAKRGDLQRTKDGHGNVFVTLG
jgi:DNA-binding IclR family transcriptional regulator